MDAKTAEATEKILKNQTSLALSWQEANSKLLRGAASSIICRIITANASDNDARLNICKFPRMVSGVYKWEFYIEEPCDDLQLGIVDLLAPSGGLDCAYSPDGSFYYHNASTGFMMRYHHDLPKHHKNSKVSFILQPSIDSYSLEASVDGGQLTLLCCGRGTKRSNCYLPAVRLQKPGNVRFRQL
jgi:hypothetical protein